MSGGQWRSVSCNVCGSNRAAIVHPGNVQAIPSYRITDHAVGAHPTLVRCRECGLVYANPQPTDAAALYAQCEPDTLYEREREARLATFAWLLDRLSRHIVGGRLLDVGCSTGLLLAAARDKGWCVDGLEPSAWAARQAAQLYKIPVVNGTLADAPFSEGDFDAITMVDVIEHLADPAANLARACRLLRPGGVLLITTPDISSAAARLLGAKWWGILPTHLWYFDRRTLGRLLAQGGFRVLESARARRNFSLAYWAVKLGSYSARLGQAAGSVLRVSGLDRRSLWVDLRDQLLVIACKE
jgi:SAM-dependent methyltransferase